MKSSRDVDLSVGELAARFQMATHVLRHWEDVGLLTPRRDGSGRRRYGRGDVFRVATIVRSKAAGLGTMANWTFNFIVSLTFLLLIEAAGRSGAFWIYGGIGILTLWFCWKFVPETKGKRLEDIQAYFQDRVDKRA